MGPEQPHLYLPNLPPVPSPQGSSSQQGVRQRALQSLERYFYLILFNYYLHEQVGRDERTLPFSGPLQPPTRDRHGVNEDPCGIREESWGHICWFQRKAGVGDARGDPEGGGP